MLRAKASGWILETAQSNHCGAFRSEGMQWSAWISDRERYIIGYATAASCEADAVRAAFADAGHHYRKDCDALHELEIAYLSPSIPSKIGETVEFAAYGRAFFGKMRWLWVAAACLNLVSAFANT